MNGINEINTPYFSTTRLYLKKKSNNKKVKLYKFIKPNGSNWDTGNIWDKLESYLLYITPNTVLDGEIYGFKGYDDIGYYCKESDIQFAESLLEVPRIWTVEYQEYMNNKELNNFKREQYDELKHDRLLFDRIEVAFSSDIVVYPKRGTDYVMQVIDTCRVYTIPNKPLFHEDGLMYLVRETHDFIARFRTVKRHGHIANNISLLLEGLYCFIPFDDDVHEDICDLCIDQTDDMREIYNQYMGNNISNPVMSISKLYSDDTYHYPGGGFH